MFILNKFYTIYNNLMEKARKRTLEQNIYTEKHHVLPKSLGGSNRKDNIVRLTAREHFIAHRLLCKFTTGQYKMLMCHALWRLCFSEKIVIPSRTYQSVREDRSSLMKSLNIKPPSQKGKPKTQDHKIKISDRLKGRKLSPSHIENLTQSNHSRNYDLFRDRLSTKHWQGKKRPSQSELMKNKNPRKDDNIYSFIHSSGKIFIGSRNDLIEAFPEHNISSSSIGLMIRGEYKSHRGWRLFANDI